MKRSIEFYMISTMVFLEYHKMSKAECVAFNRIWGNIIFTLISMNKTLEVELKLAIYQG